MAFYLVIEFESIRIAKINKGLGVNRHNCQVCLNHVGLNRHDHWVGLTRVGKIHWVCRSYVEQWHHYCH